MLGTTSATTRAVRALHRARIQPARAPILVRRLATTPTPSPPPSSTRQPGIIGDEFQEALRDLREMRGYEAPSIGARLRPLIPFFIWWTIITSLLLHLLQERKRGEAELDRAAAQESVLRALLERFEAGEVVPDAEIRQQLEMVGLRKRQDTGTLGEELGKVSWWEVMLGRKRQQEVVVEEVESVADKTDEEVVQELGKIVAEATAAEEAAKAAADPMPAHRSGHAKRATSANMYM